MPLSILYDITLMPAQMWLMILFTHRLALTSLEKACHHYSSFLQLFVINEISFILQMLSNLPSSSNSSNTYPMSMSI